MRRNLLLVAAGIVLAGAAFTAAPAATAAEGDETRLHTPAGSTEPARSGERTPPSEVKHFGGRVTATGDDRFEARSWLGFGREERFLMNRESKFIRHGEERPLSDLKVGDYVGVWYVLDAEGNRRVEKVQIGGRNPRPR